jgi:putative polyketide hydroxylase
LRCVAVSHEGWLAEVCLPAEGALLLRPDAVVAWHSTSETSLADALTRVLGSRVSAGQLTGSAR